MEIEQSLEVGPQLFFSNNIQLGTIVHWRYFFRQAVGGFSACGAACALP